MAREEKKEYVINIESLKEGENELTGKIQSNYLEIDGLQGVVDLECCATKMNREISVTGKITFNLKLECARCLGEFTNRYTENINTTFLPEKSFDNFNEKEINDPEVNFYAKDAINLVPLVRDTILLSIPIKPICKVDCKGLCCICGKNLNEESCSCIKK